MALVRRTYPQMHARCSTHQSARGAQRHALAAARRAVPAHHHSGLDGFLRVQRLHPLGAVRSLAVDAAVHGEVAPHVQVLHGRGVLVST